jgi:hypothetical protein
VDSLLDEDWGVLNIGFPFWYPHIFEHTRLQLISIPKENLKLQKLILMKEIRFEIQLGKKIG